MASFALIASSTARSTRTSGPSPVPRNCSPCSAWVARSVGQTRAPGLAPTRTSCACQVGARCGALRVSNHVPQAEDRPCEPSSSEPARPVLMPCLFGGLLNAGRWSGYGAGHPPVAADLGGQHDGYEVEAYELLEALDALFAGVGLDCEADRHEPSLARQLTQCDRNREFRAPARPGPEAPRRDRHLRLRRRRSDGFQVTVRPYRLHATHTHAHHACTSRKSWGGP